MEEKFRLEFLDMVSRFADDKNVMLFDGCLCALLRKYDINEKHTELCVLENENEKILVTGFDGDWAITEEGYCMKKYLKEG